MQPINKNEEGTSLKAMLEQKRNELEKENNMDFVRPTEDEMAELNAKPKDHTVATIEKQEKEEERDKELDVIVGQEGEAKLSVEDLSKDANTPGQIMSNVNKYISDLETEVKETEKLAEQYKKENESREQIAKIEESKKTQFNDIIEEVDNESEGEAADEDVIDLTSIKIKKPKNEDKAFSDYISKRNQSEHSTLVILPNSGFTASIRGLSSPEIRDVTSTLNNRDNFGYYDYLYKTIHKKIEDTSVGAMDYETFLKRTGLTELEILLYGLFCSSYPESNTYPSECACGAKFEFNYNNVDYMDLTNENREEILEAMRAVLKGQAIDPVKLFENSATNSIVRKKLPSGIIVDLRHPTLYNQLFDTIANIDQNDLQTISESTLNLMPYVESVFVPEDDGYVIFTDLKNKMGILSKIDDKDDVALNTAVSDEILSKYNISFNMRNVQCPLCKKVLDPQPVSFLPMLFMTHRIKHSSKK